MQSVQTMPCSLESIHAGEQLFGTAPLTKIWLLLEADLAWGKKALDESSLPESVKEHLNRAVKQVPAGRITLIRQPGRNRQLSFFICAQGHLLKFGLDRYEQLLEFDIPALLTTELANHPQRVDHPLYLICTNGRRDACCAQHGPQFYAAFSPFDAEHTWQTTHVGGHRFAAVMVHLPSGVYYGRLRPEHATDMYTALQSGHTPAAFYRGRSAYPAVIQAAEGLLLPGIDPDVQLHFGEPQQIDEHTWEIETHTSHGQYARVQITSRNNIAIRTSCAEDKPESVPQWELLVAPVWA